VGVVDAPKIDSNGREDDIPLVDDLETVELKRRREVDDATW